MIGTRGRTGSTQQAHGNMRLLFFEMPVQATGRWNKLQVLRRVALAKLSVSMLRNLAMCSAM
jgi:hypothetical protein